ncbi:MAG: zinc dependent phospholipase C family protein [Bacteroidota bacterium]|nr:zinc dependent phospholipase C family protein [Bacteroidota bacterium]MDX5430815.1 zinc dependent phospholipase C family protein [Bacteroidota bacterium]MDX5469561.1 zinc dependent phospholipase C family protein [Bacteroidota bacterium]
MFRFLFFLLIALLCGSWGFFGHKSINEHAIYALPTELMGFYKAHADYLIEHSVDPDKRRYSVPEEAPRHYLDADYYEWASPIDTLPHSWLEAVNCYTEDTLNAYGIGPWHLQKMLWRLTSAFAAKDEEGILKQSSELGHYAADLCVPLHSTMNYNGQLTGQKGIHGFWESRLVELYSGEYSFYVGPAEYVEHPGKLIWEVFEESFAARDSVLEMEKSLSLNFTEERKFAFEEQGNGLVKVYSREYSKAYHENLNGMVERRMRRAVKLVADLWYTAWVNAGSPSLKIKGY